MHRDFPSRREGRSCPWEEEWPVQRHRGRSSGRACGGWAWAGVPTPSRGATVMWSVLSLLLKNYLFLTALGLCCCTRAFSHCTWGLSCPAACGILPDRRLNPCSLHWQAESQPLDHQGGPCGALLERAPCVCTLGGDTSFLTCSPAWRVCREPLHEASPGLCCW